MTKSVRKLLTEALSECFDLCLEDLSREQKTLVEDTFFPISWDMLNAAERRELAEQLDYINNPEHYELRQYWFEFVAKRQELENAIADWTALAAVTVTELATKEERLKQLKSELKALENAYENASDGETPLFPIKEPGETPHQRKSRLEAWYLVEKKRRKAGALKRTAAREGITHQTLSAILKRQ